LLDFVRLEETDARLDIVPLEQEREAQRLDCLHLRLSFRVVDRPNLPTVIRTARVPRRTATPWRPRRILPRKFLLIVFFPHLLLSLRQNVAGFAQQAHLLTRLVTFRGSNHKSWSQPSTHKRGGGKICIRNCGIGKNATKGLAEVRGEERSGGV
jgi:hypothetical protein